MAYTPIIRLFVDADLAAGAVLSLAREHVHYLINVMRRRADDQIAVFNGRDGEWLAELTTAEKRKVEVTLLELRRAQTAEPDLWLAFAPIKRARLDFTVQKATELGVSKLMPVITERTMADRVKQDRITANMVEAAEQSERLTVPVADPPQKLGALLAAWPDTRPLIFCDESLEGQSIADALDGMTPGPMGVLIGPEGGFTDAERTKIKAHPAAIPVSLGPRILRADTAALATLGVVQALVGDWRRRSS